MHREAEQQVARSHCTSVIAAIAAGESRRTPCSSPPLASAAKTRATPSAVACRFIAGSSASRQARGVGLRRIEIGIGHRHQRDVGKAERREIGFDRWRDHRRDARFVLRGVAEMDVGFERAGDLARDERAERFADGAAEDLAGEKAERAGVIAGVLAGAARTALAPPASRSTRPNRKCLRTCRRGKARQADLMREHVRNRGALFAVGGELRPVARARALRSRSGRDRTAIAKATATTPLVVE